MHERSNDLKPLFECAIVAQCCAGGTGGSRLADSSAVAAMFGGYNFASSTLEAVMNFSIPPVAAALAADLRHRIDNKTKPLGALGRLESLALQIGLARGELAPTLRQPQLAVFAADHGAAKAGVSAFPQDVTWQMVENFLAGGAAINVFARGNGLALSIVDAGVAHDFSLDGTPRAGLIDAKIAAGTANFIEAPAMTAAEVEAAMARGAALAHAWADAGCDVLGFGEMGIGNTAAASLLTHVLTNTPLDTCIGRGTGLDDSGLARKRELLAKAVARVGDVGQLAPRQVLAEFGGLEIAMMAGAMLGAAERRIVLLIDGFIVGAAALVAARLHPEILPYCVFCHQSAEPGHRAQLQALGGEPLLDLGLRLGEGTGAALAWPLVKAAADFLRDMASFESAGVSGKDATA